MLFNLIIVLIIVYFTCKLYLYYIFRNKYWIWDDGAEDKRHKIDTNDLHFPAYFLWGTSSASYQCEGYGDLGKVDSNWSDWEAKTNPETGLPRIKRGQKCGNSVDHYNRIEEDIGLMKELGCNSYRFSLAWDKIESYQGKYNEKVIQHYHHELDQLLNQNIVPMITFHHFTHPLWFEQNGAFLNESNVAIFVKFALDMFQEYQTKCYLWCTINEPEVYVSGGYFQGMFPPGHKSKPDEASLVMKHLLEAHVRIYDNIKKISSSSSKHQIGIVKDIFQFEPYNPLNPLDHYLASILDNSMNSCILNFFKTGKYVWNMRGSQRLEYSNIKAINSNDFFGLNYYSHFHVKFQFNLKQPFKLVHQSNILMTDMSHPIYPEGIYRACMRVRNELGNIPIYITENGIADEADDRRHLYLRRYLYAISKAIKDGCDIRGYYYWSLLDNFEWAEGYDMKFGLYHVDLKTQKRILRDGSKYFREVIKKYI